MTNVNIFTIIGRLTAAATPASAPAPSAPTYGEYGADEFDAVEEDDLPF